MSVRLSNLFVLLFIVFANLAAAQEIEIPAGTVIAVSGTVKAVGADKQERILKRGDSVHAGEMIVVDPSAKVQVKFTDGSLYNFTPNTEYRIESYSFNTPGQENSSVGSLLKGSFRAVTGTIARETPQNFEIKTPVGTLSSPQPTPPPSAGPAPEGFQGPTPPPPSPLSGGPAPPGMGGGGQEGPRSPPLVIGVAGGEQARLGPPGGGPPPPPPFTFSVSGGVADVSNDGGAVTVGGTDGNFATITGPDAFPEVTTAAPPLLNQQDFTGPSGSEAPPILVPPIETPTMAPAPEAAPVDAGTLEGIPAGEEVPSAISPVEVGAPSGDVIDIPATESLCP